MSQWCVTSGSPCTFKNVLQAAEYCCVTMNNVLLDDYEVAELGQDFSQSCITWSWGGDDIM